MKQILFLIAVLVFVGSCVNQRQKSSIVGKSDEVYFTPSDNIAKAKVKKEQDKTPSEENSNQKNYTGSYADRLNNFGSGSRFNHNIYQPVLLPSAMYNNYTGWNIGTGFGYQYNSPFSPYYGYQSPYYDPFYTSGNFMNPMGCICYNPYYYGNYNNNYYYPAPTYSKPANYGRRTGTTSPSGNKNTPTRTEQSTKQNNPQNSNNSGKNSWWNSTTAPSSSPSSSGGSDRKPSGNSGASSRRK